MKNVIIVDASPLFREFLKDKLSTEKVSVSIAQGKRDAFTKMISTLPDLVILDVQESFEDLLEFLEKKYNDPNASRIPIIAAGPLVERTKIAVLAQFGVIKYFTKPIKFDVLFESIGHILKLSFSMDVTPCLLDIHRTGNIIFIEVAQGLNREKLALLKYKLSEMIENEKLETPKAILMMTNLDLSFVDGSNLELLLDNILANPKIQTKNLKVLSFSSFARDLISGHPRYSGIEVTTNLSQVLNSLVDSSSFSNMSDLITDKILTADGEQVLGSIETRFYSDTGVIQDDESLGNVLRIALVDDDTVILKIIENAFKTIGAVCDLYSNGTEFITGVNKHKYDLVILDIMMPGISGFDILKRLQETQGQLPVIVYSQATQKETVVQALSLGARRYLVKPQKPEVIIQKAIELLHGKI
jgi:Response regulator containing CheY-like receiver, AAA-type ATPase, and DNA-binding domains